MLSIPSWTKILYSSSITPYDGSTVVKSVVPKSSIPPERHAPWAFPRLCRMEDPTCSVASVPGQITVDVLSWNQVCWNLYTWRAMATFATTYLALSYHLQIPLRKPSVDVKPLQSAPGLNLRCARGASLLHLRQRQRKNPWEFEIEAWLDTGKSGKQVHPGLLQKKKKNLLPSISSPVWFPCDMRHIASIARFGRHRFRPESRSRPPCARYVPVVAYNDIVRSSIFKRVHV